VHDGVVTDRQIGKIRQACRFDLIAVGDVGEATAARYVPNLGDPAGNT
jgi:hypothetical protein